MREALPAPGLTVFPGACLARRVLALLALVSCGVLAQQTVEVAIQDYRFSPREVHIKVGDTVRWTNREKRTSHSVLFPAENGLESERLLPAEHWQRSFAQPGTYAYRCGPHEEMKGVIVVE
ncbi:MAG: cupredoxin domain-containing protein [Sulfuritalea sp.]|nr:cupredoxin domain-containing protein [Sulfuritalea sp.]